MSNKGLASTAYKRLATADSIPKRHSRILHVKTPGIRAGQYDSILYTVQWSNSVSFMVLLFCLYYGKNIFTAIIRQGSSLHYLYMTGKKKHGVM